MHTWTCVSEFHALVMWMWGSSLLNNWAMCFASCLPSCAPGFLEQLMIPVEPTLFLVLIRNLRLLLALSTERGLPRGSQAIISVGITVKQALIFSSFSRWKDHVFHRFLLSQQPANLNIHNHASAVHMHVLIHQCSHTCMTLYVWMCSRRFITIISTCVRG